MKNLKLVPAYLLALVYLVFGSNYFLGFIKMPPMDGNAGQFIGLLYSTGFLAFVKVLEVLFGLLLLVPKTRSLALLILAPISVNILLFEVYMQGKPGIGILLIFINALAITVDKDRYKNIIS